MRIVLNAHEQSLTVPFWMLFVVAAAYVADNDA